jgi:2-keto-4-pentenoate hydratase
VAAQGGEGEVLKSGVKLDLDDFCQLAIEGEMAFRVDKNCQIESDFPVIELHNLIFRGKRKTLPELIANNGINAGIVLPDANWQQSAKRFQNEASLKLSLNGTSIGDSKLWPSDDGPEASLMWLKKNLKVSGIELLPGNIVLAGTALGLYPVKDGDEVTVSINGQPAVSCSIRRKEG